MMAGDPLERIAAALERLSPPPPSPPDFAGAAAWRWATDPDRLTPVPQVDRVAMELLVGIDRARDVLLDNTLRFARGLAANNALLWGARGMGKSSLVKAAHAAAWERTGTCILIEIRRDDIPSIGRLMEALRGESRRFLLFCDDLGFDRDETHYKSLKAALDGGIAGRPENALFYATSNRRHLMPRDMIENESGSAIAPSEAVEEKVSLSDRFGLWLGFHPCTQEDYFAMIRGYCAHFGLDIGEERLRAEATEWRRTRGAISGRVAWQFVQDLAGRRGKSSHSSGKTAAQKK